MSRALFCYKSKSLCVESFQDYILTVFFFVLPLDDVKVKSYKCREWVEVLSLLPLWANAQRRVEQWPWCRRMSPKRTHLTAWTHWGHLRKGHKNTCGSWWICMYTISITAFTEMQNNGWQGQDSVCYFSLPRGVKRTVEATRKPSISPTTTMQTMTEPNRHQLITRMTPPTTPNTADTARRTAANRQKCAGHESQTPKLSSWEQRQSLESDPSGGNSLS